MFRCRLDFDKASRGKRSVPPGSLSVMSKTAAFKKALFCNREKCVQGVLKDKRRMTMLRVFCFKVRISLIDESLRLDVKLGRCGESGEPSKLLDSFDPR